MTSAYGATPAQLFLTRQAAALAGAAKVVFTTVAVGDGNGTVPALSDQGVGLVHEVWRGAVNSVAVNGNNSQQIDINVAIPDGAGSFDIRELMVLDENGNQVVAGICNLVKPSSGSDNVSANFSFYISIVIADTQAVTLINPTGGFATTAWVEAQLAALSLTPGPAGAAGAAPILQAGNTTELAAGAVATFVVRPLGNNTYALDTGIPQGAPGTAAVQPTFAPGNVTQLAAGASPTFNLRQTSANVYAVDVGLPIGVQGQTGAAPTITIGTVATLAPGANATATISPLGNNAYALNLGIPDGPAPSAQDVASFTLPSLVPMGNNTSATFPMTGFTAPWGAGSANNFTFSKAGTYSVDVQIEIRITTLENDDGGPASEGRVYSSVTGYINGTPVFLENEFGSAYNYIGITTAVASFTRFFNAGDNISFVGSGTGDSFSAGSVSYIAPSTITITKIR